MRQFVRQFSLCPCWCRRASVSEPSFARSCVLGHSHCTCSKVFSVCCSLYRHLGAYIVRSSKVATPTLFHSSRNIHSVYGKKKKKNTAQYLLPVILLSNGVCTRPKHIRHDRVNMTSSQIIVIYEDKHKP